MLVDSNGQFLGTLKSFLSCVCKCSRDCLVKCQIHKISLNIVIYLQCKLMKLKLHAGKLLRILLLFLPNLLIRIVVLIVVAHLLFAIDRATFRVSHLVCYCFSLLDRCKKLSIIWILFLVTLKCCKMNRNEGRFLTGVLYLFIRLGESVNVV